MPRCGFSPPPSSSNSVRPKKNRRGLMGVLATAFVLVVCLCGVFYWRPLWVIDECRLTWLRLDGVRSEYVQLGSFRVHYFAGGRGRPLVLVHGLGARAENWTELMTALVRRSHRVYAIDLLGFGRSDHPDVDYSIALQSEVLKQFLDSQNLARADLGGWSMGGWVVLKFALDHPERVRRIFVVDSAGLSFKLLFDPEVFEPATVDQAQQLLFLLTPKANRIPRFVARDLVREMRPKRWVVQRAVKSMMARTDLLDGKLPAIHEPVLIVWGRQDKLIPPICGEEMRRQMPQSLFALFDGCGHLMAVECSDRLLPETLHFLDAEPPLPASVHEFPADSRQ